MPNYDILQAHYKRAEAAMDRYGRFTHEGESAAEAADCAALHVGLDAMARIQARRRPAPQVGDADTRKPQAGCVASYPALREVEPSFVALSLIRPMLRHKAALHAAWQRADDYAALAPIGRAQAVADHYARRL